MFSARNLLSALVCLCALSPVSFASAAAGDSQTAAILTGRIKLPGGEPATSASVTALGARTEMDFDLPVFGRTTADQKGRFEIAVPRAEQYVIAVQHPRAAYSVTDWERLKSKEDDPAAAPERLEKDIDLTSGTTISGRIVDQLGKSITGAVITPKLSEHFPISLAPKSAGFTTETVKGQFTLTNMKSGKNGLVVEAIGHTPLETELEGPSTSVTLQLKTTGAVIEGMMVRKDNRDTVSSGVVMMIPGDNPGDFRSLLVRKVVTDDFGSFSFTNLAAGKYSLLGMKEGLTPEWHGDFPGVSVSVEENETTSGVTILMERAYTIYGVVRDDVTSLPIAGAEVKTLSISSGFMVSKKSAADGSYRFTDVTPIRNILPVSAEKSGYSGTGMAFDGGVTESVRPGIYEYERDIRLAPLVPVSGVVQNSDGQGIRGAKIELENNRGTKPTETGTTGTFTITVPPNASHTFVVTKAGLPRTRSKSIAVKTKPVSGIIITAGSGATVMGQVVDPAGAPVESAKIKLFGFTSDNSQEELQKKDTASDGRFTLTAVPAGRVQITAEHDSYASATPLTLKLADQESTSGFVLQLKKSHKITGKVVDVDGKPLESVNVIANRGIRVATNTTARTEKDGTYKLDKLEQGEYNLNFMLQGYKTHQLKGIAVDRSGVDVILKLAPKVTLIGKVIDGKTGEPISNYSVQATNPYQRDGKDRKLTAIKDETQPGTFRIKDLSEGGYIIVGVEAPGYARLSTETIQVPNDKSELEKTFRLSVPGAVKGRVVDAAGKPMPGVMARLAGRPLGGGGNSGMDSMGFTDADGKFLLHGAGAGDMTIEFTPPKPYAVLRQDANIEAGQTIDMGDVTIGNPGRLFGRLVTMPGGKGIPNVSLRLNSQDSGGQNSVSTNDNGEFEFTGVGNGNFNLSVPEQDRNWSIAMQTGEEKEITLRVGSAVLHGRVMRGDQPEQISVYARQGTIGTASSYSTTSDADGYFEFDKLTPGRWQIMLYGNNGTVEEDIVMPDEGKLEKVFQLSSGELKGRVTDASGVPVPQANVTARAKNKPGSTWDDALPQQGRGGGSSAQTDEQGEFNFTGLAPGEYKLTASKKDFGTGVADGIAVENNGKHELPPIILRNQRGGTLISTALTMGTGGPIKDAWCSLWDESGEKFNHSVVRDDRGVITIPDIPPGMYRVQVSSFGFSVSEKRVEIRPGETTSIEDVLYDAGALRLAIVDSNGSGVPDADCTITADDPNSIEAPRKLKTDKTGALVIRGLFPGTYTITASTTDGKSGTAKAVIQAHQVGELSASVK